MQEGLSRALGPKDLPNLKAIVTKCARAPGQKWFRADGGAKRMAEGKGGGWPRGV